MASKLRAVLCRRRASLLEVERSIIDGLQDGVKIPRDVKKRLRLLGANRRKVDSLIAHEDYKQSMAQKPS